MTTIATICARGGSVGLPGKNIKPMLGKPLLVYSIEQALACRAIERVFVSTDDENIAAAALAAGAEVPGLRPAYLATSSAGKLDAITHLVSVVESQGVGVSKIVDLDPTSPLRDLRDIEVCVEMLDEQTDAVITGYLAEKNPYFNMVEVKDDGAVRLVKESSRVLSRQQAPVVYSMNASIYVWHRHTLERGLWDGATRIHVMPYERSVDIDTPFQFRIVEMLLAEKLRAAIR